MNHKKIIIPIIVLLLLFSSIFWLVLLANQSITAKRAEQNKIQQLPDYETSLNQEPPVTNPEFIKYLGAATSSVDTTRWKTYRNDVIGLAFKYPSGWAGVNISLEDLTDLHAMTEQLKSGDFEPGRDRHSFKINFQEGGPSMLIFDNDYAGTAYVHSDAPNQPTPRDNIKELLNSGNICDYRVKSFLSDRDRERYFWCSNGNNTILTEADDRSENFAKFEVYLYGYKHLQNDSFPNLFVDGLIENTTTPYDNTPDYYVYNNQGSDVVADRYSTLAKFVSTIETFTPKPKKYESQSTSTVTGRDDVSILRRYYYSLASANFKIAYSMLLKPATSSSAYAKRNEYLFKADPKTFRLKSDGSYGFFVQTQKHNSQPENYVVNAKVIKGKIKIISEYLLFSEPAVKGNLAAYGYIKNQHDLLLLETKGKTIYVENHEDPTDNEVGQLRFINLDFSTSSRYLTYITSGWEWANGNVYDIKTGTTTLKGFGINKYGFTPDEKYFYACSMAGMASMPEVKIYETGKWKQVYSPKELKLSDHMVYDVENCKLSADKKSLSIDLVPFDPVGSDSAKLSVKIIYNFETNKMTRKVGGIK